MMLVHILSILGGLVLLVLGAEGLVRGSSGLAFRLGVSALAVGLTVVAFGTGSPELVLSVEAALAGSSGIALGNIVGSNIANMALVLGVAAVVRPMTVCSTIVRREMPLMIAVTLVLCAFLIDGTLERFEGLMLVIGAVVYTISTYVVARRGEGAVVEGEFEEAYPKPHRPVWLDIVMIVAGLMALALGAQLLLEGAVAIAAGLGVSEVVIGLTIVAVGTSLPELATSISAARRSEADVALGNAIGSNVLNILAVLGITALIQPLELAGLRAVDLAVLVGSAVVMLLFMRRGWVLSRREGSVLLLGYVVYVITLVP